ncbi:MAG: PilZ domain-containing protein [Oligoflexia bacterium]|nr:PilZ domain-containing protein [Oligoflexia bacterium]
MWQAPNQRIRSLQSAKKRQQDRLRRPLHIKRVRAELKVVGHGTGQGAISEARILLNDLSPTGVGIFSNAAILVGQEIAITLQDPKRVYLRGRVVWCQEYDLHRHVISSSPFSYRMGIHFLFRNQEEEDAVKAFCNEVLREHLFSAA